MPVKIQSLSERVHGYHSANYSSMPVTITDSNGEPVSPDKRGTGAGGDAANMPAQNQPNKSPNQLPLPLPTYVTPSSDIMKSGVVVWPLVELNMKNRGTRDGGYCNGHGSPYNSASYTRSINYHQTSIMIAFVIFMTVFVTQ